METSYLTRTGHQVGRVSAVGLRHTDTISDGIPTFQVSQGNQAVLGFWLWQCRQRPDIVVECCPNYWDSHSTLKKKKKHCCLRLGCVSASFSWFCVLLSSSEHTLLAPFWMFYWLSEIFTTETMLEFSVALRPKRPYGLLGTGSPGRPPRLSHSSWALKQDSVQRPQFLKRGEPKRNRPPPPPQKKKIWHSMKRTRWWRGTRVDHFANCTGR